VPRYVGICAVLANWLIPSPLILGEALENPPFALDRQKKHVRRCFVAGCISMQGSKRDRRVYVRIIEQTLYVHSGKSGAPEKPSRGLQ
jgi:hypothetical protein